MLPCASTLSQLDDLKPSLREMASIFWNGTRRARNVVGISSLILTFRTQRALQQKHLSMNKHGTHNT